MLFMFDVLTELSDWKDFPFSNRKKETESSLYSFSLYISFYALQGALLHLVIISFMKNYYIGFWV